MEHMQNSQPNQEQAERESIGEYMNQVAPVGKVWAFIKANKMRILIALAIASTFTAVRWAMTNHPNISAIVVVAVIAYGVDKLRRARKQA